MNKDKLIKTIQSDRNISDEREVLINKSARRWGTLGSLSIILLLMVIRYVSGELFTQDILLIAIVQTTFTSIYIYTKKKTKTDLLISIVGTLVTLLVLYNVISYYGLI